MNDEKLLSRIASLEKAALEHEDLIVNVEKSAMERAEELNMDFKDYKKTSKDDIRAIRKYFACYGFCFVSHSFLQLLIFFFSKVSIL